MFRNLAVASTISSCSKRTGADFEISCTAARICKTRESRFLMLESYFSDNFCSLDFRASGSCPAIYSSVLFACAFSVKHFCSASCASENTTPKNLRKVVPWSLLNTMSRYTYTFCCSRAFSNIMYLYLKLNASCLLSRSSFSIFS